MPPPYLTQDSILPSIHIFPSNVDGVLIQIEMTIKRTLIKHCVTGNIPKDFVLDSGLFLSLTAERHTCPPSA